MVLRDATPVVAQVLALVLVVTSKADRRVLAGIARASIHHGRRQLQSQVRARQWVPTYSVALQRVPAAQCASHAAVWLRGRVLRALKLAAAWLGTWQYFHSLTRLGMFHTRWRVCRAPRVVSP